ncbi:hypothetical protein ID1001_14160 [Helicobacter pylori]
MIGFNTLSNEKGFLALNLEATLCAPHTCRFNFVSSHSMNNKTPKQTKQLANNETDKKQE